MEPLPFHSEQRRLGLVEQDRVVMQDRDLPAGAQDQAKRFEWPLTEGLQNVCCTHAKRVRSAGSGCKPSAELRGLFGIRCAALLRQSRVASMSIQAWIAGVMNKVELVREGRAAWVASARPLAEQARRIPRQGTILGRSDRESVQVPVGGRLVRRARYGQKNCRKPLTCPLSFPSFCAQSIGRKGLRDLECCEP